MVVHCSSKSCGRAAPADIQSRLLLALNVTDIFDLFLEKNDAVDCPHCGARAAITPSLAGLFLVEGSVLLLDRGFDPEPAALKALAPLAASLRAEWALERVETLAQFKEVFAAKVTATASKYPYSEFISNERAEKDLANWQGLQGEVLSALYAGAVGAVPRFGLHAADTEGRRASVKETTNVIETLVLRLLAHWSFGLAILSRTTPLEELLIRLVDSYGVVAFMADRVVDELAEYRRAIEQPGVDRLIRFHFCALEASLYVMIGRQNPNAAEWAREYLMVRCAALSNAADDGQFLLGSKRVATTISYENAWDAVAFVAQSLMSIKDEDERAREFEILDAATNDLGHKHLLSAVLDGSLRIAVDRRSKGDLKDAEKKEPIEHTPESLASLILRIRADDDRLSLSAMIKVWHLSWFSDPHAVAQLYDLLEPTARTDIEQRADLLTWLGERMKFLGTPTFALGEEPAQWETQLSDEARRALWTERSNMLRLTGDRVRALSVAQETLRITLADPEASDSNKSTAWTNCGILLRENGRFADAVKCLLRAATLAPEARRWAPLQSLATTFLQMGRMSDAAEALAQARQTAGGPELSEIRSSLLVTEISVRMQLGQWAKAEKLIGRCPAPEAMPDTSLIGYVNILQSLASRTRNFDAYRATAEAVVGRLTGLVSKFEEAGNPIQGHAACHSAAALAHAFALPEAEQLWYRDAAISMAADRLPDPRTAIELAICGIRDNPTCFHDRISVIPVAIAQQAASVSLDAETIDLLSPLVDPFNRLMLLTYESDLGAPAVQIVAEIRRNAHRKAVHSTTHENQSFSFGPSVSAAMPSDHAPFVVLEWCDVPQGMLGLITFVSKGGGQAEYTEIAGELDLFETAEKIGARLDNWHSGRTGQPYETAQWQLMRERFRSVAATLLPDGGHVVILDHAALVGIPFHILLAPNWTVSYASDWIAIEAAVAANGLAPSRPKLGVLHAPRSNETVAVRAALRDSAARTRDLATDKALEFDLAEVGAADADAFSRLLATTDLLKVLCHGQVNKEDHQVVLVIDHENTSPPGYSFGVMLETTQGHRFGRDQLAEQRIASRTIFLGACSGGLVSVAGLDERTSFASQLAGAGTESVVAPRWKIDAELALPVVDDALARFVDGMPLAKAVSAAAEQAIKQGVPTWQAYAFVVEGAWM